MPIRTTLVIAIAALCSAPLAAQTCSGGIDGGMDAQGCDCNDADVVATSTPDASAARSTAAPMPTDVAWTHALDLYDHGDYADAMVDLRTAAEHGHPLAAEMLALMYRFGERRYGAKVHANAVEAAHFTALAVALRHNSDALLTAKAPAPGR